MLFLINNPGIAFILIVVIGFSVLMSVKIIEEVKLNSKLSIKQRSMRLVNPVKGLKARIAFLSSAALAPVAATVVVVSVALNPTITMGTNLVELKSSDDVLEIYTDFQEKMNASYNNLLWEASNFDKVDSLGLPEAADGENFDSGSDDYSETNNQVVGVDEMDNVLTDGKYIYTINEGGVQIVLAYTVVDGPDVLSLYKTLEYTNDTCDGYRFYPQGMYVDENHLVVIGNEYTWECQEYTDGEDKPAEDTSYDYDIYWRGSNTLKVLVYDKTNNFELQDEYTMNGYLIGTRKIDNDLYIVTNNYIPFYDEDLNIDDYLSKYTVNGVETVTLYEDIIYIEGSSPNSFTTFYGIDLDTSKVDMETVLGDSGYNLYVSNENMYLVGAVYYFWPMVDYVDVENPVYETETAIMKITIDNGEVEYANTGTVNGYTLNQFSMDEHNGYLRIATTSGWVGKYINNRLYILDEELNKVAVLENLGKPGETIKATRFVGDYAYLVTFERTDPFYVINLSDPENPAVEGELLIPGFSTYLQPLNENYMLGIGFGDNSGGTQGLKISIYDITDKANPVIFDEVIFDYSEFGWGYSTVTYNHKDLLVSLDKGIIALPFSTYSYNENDFSYSYSSGILVYNIDLVDGFTFNGFVSHSVEFANEESAYDVYVYKSKFIDDYFYTISNKYVKVSTIEDTETILDSVDLK